MGILWFVKSRRAQNDQDYETWVAGGGNMPLMNEGPIVRRLTPMECERLQGFPDGWTSHRIDDKKGLVEQADSARYKQMGNAVAVPVVEWVMERLVRVDQDRFVENVERNYELD
jgi:site-specific DNA-cytosine methylase